MLYIFDTQLFTALRDGSLKLSCSNGAKLLATSEQLRVLRNSPNSHLCSNFQLGRPSFITEPSVEGDGRDGDWVQNGPEVDELAHHLGSERHPEWKVDLEIVEVALNEKAVLVSNRHILQVLMERFEGRSILSLEFLQL